MKRMDHEALALERLPQRLRKTLFVALTKALAKSRQRLEDAALEFQAQRALSVSTGKQLDRIGEAVGQPRDTPDDNTYRRRIRAKIAVNRSSGLVDDLLRVARLVVNNSATNLSVESSAATAVMHVDGVGLGDAEAADLAAFGQRATSAGVRFLLHSNTDSDAESFVHSYIPAAMLGGSPVTPETYWIFIIGQSNAIGKGLASEMEAAEPGITAPFPAVQIYDQNSKFTNPPTWVIDALRDLSPRPTVIDGVQFPANGAGIELTMGRELAARTPHTIRIAKLAIDSSSLDANWTEPTWPTGGPSLQDQFYAFVAARLASIPGSKIGAVVLINGESDSGASPADVNFRANAHALIDPLRTTYPTHNFLVVQHRLSKRYGSPLIVASGQESFVADQGALGAVTYGDDLPFSDFAHYTSASLLTLGRRIADPIVRHLLGQPVSGPRWVASGFPSEAGGGTGLAPTIPSFAVGDIAIAVVAGIGTGAYATPSGWTPIATQHGGGTATRLQVFARVLTAGDVAHGTVSFPDISGDDAKTARIHVIRGGTLGAAFGASSGTAGTTITWPEVTTAGDNALVLYIGAHDIDSATDNQVTFAQPTHPGDLPIVQHSDLSTSQGSGSGSAVAAQVRPYAGVAPAATATIASSTWAAVAVVIEAAAVPDGRWAAGASVIAIDPTGTDAWPRTGQCQITGGLFSGEQFAYRFYAPGYLAFAPVMPFASTVGEMVEPLVPGKGFGDSTETGHPVLTSYTNVGSTGGRLSDVR